MLLAVFTSLFVSALAAPLSERQSLPFKQMVAFGDNLSDNGNGSYAHGVTDPSHKNPKVYGFGTWTNGPVAVSYLSDNIKTPLVADFAYGHADGGSKFGATIDNTYTKSTAGAPSSKDQINNYTTTYPNVKSSIADTLHFLWIGNNDINLYHFFTDKPSAPDFAQQFSTMLAAQVQTLITSGAKYVFVPGLYAKEISPSKKFYASNAQQYSNMGSIITEANQAIEQALKPFGSKVLYYDVASFMRTTWTNASSNGFTHVGDEFCDGYSDQDFKDCLVPGTYKDEFFWTQYLDMTTKVHSMIAQDMAKAIQGHSWS